MFLLSEATPFQKDPENQAMEVSEKDAKHTERRLFKLPQNPHPKGRFSDVTPCSIS